MTIFGAPLETVYLVGFIIGVVLVLLYVLIGDIFHAFEAGDPGGIINPTAILSFITIFSGSGFAFEKTTGMRSEIIAVFSLVIALVLVALIHFFVLVPLRNSETSTAFGMEEFKGRSARVISTIPSNGYGEVLIESNHGHIARTAKSADESSIKEGLSVTIEDVQDNVVIVRIKNT